MLWKIGHGHTVVNEHGVVLGLTNDQWSHLGAPVVAALLAVGVVAVAALHGGRLTMVATALALAGLGLSAVAAYVWVLYSLGALLLYAGMTCLAMTILRGRVLPRWSAVALLVAVVSFLPLTFAPESVFAVSTTALTFLVQGDDIIVFFAALSWTALGVALLRTQADRARPTLGGRPLREGHERPASSRTQLQ